MNRPVRGSSSAAAPKTTPRGKATAKKGANSPAGGVKAGGPSASRGNKAGTSQPAGSATSIVLPGTSTSPLSEEEEKAVLNFSQALIRQFGANEEIFTPQLFERVWLDLDPARQEEVSVEERLLPWLSDRLGLSTSESKAVVSTAFTAINTENKVQKSRFLEVVPKRVALRKSGAAATGFVGAQPLSSSAGTATQDPANLVSSTNHYQEPPAATSSSVVVSSPTKPNTTTRPASGTTSRASRGSVSNKPGAGLQAPGGSNKLLSSPTGKLPNKATAGAAGGPLLPNTSTSTTGAQAPPGSTSLAGVGSSAGQQAGVGSSAEQQAAVNITSTPGADPAHQLDSKANLSSSTSIPTQLPTLLENQNSLRVGAPGGEPLLSMSNSINYYTGGATGGDQNSMKDYKSATGAGDQHHNNVVIAEELEKMTSVSKMFEQSQKKILDELVSMRKETEKAKMRNFDISAKLRDVLTALDQSNQSNPASLSGTNKGAGTTGAAGVPSTNSNPPYSARLPVPPLNNNAGGGNITAANKQTTPREQPQLGVSNSKDPMSGTMTSARTDITQLNSRDKLSTSAERNTSKTPAAATGGAAALSGSAESNKLQNSGEQREQQAKAESEQKQREQQEAFAKEIDKMRGDLAQLRQELGAEITRREEAELESEYKDHKVQVAESRCAKAEHEKRTEELKASEMQRCLELLQEDVVKKTREVELKYLEQERRIAMQQEMYSKMHRLQNFLPPNIIQKSFLSDMNM